MTASGRHRVDRVWAALCGLALGLMGLALVVIVVDAVRGGWGALSWRFLSRGSGDDLANGGVWPALYGTAVLTVCMSVVVMPLGVATAVYLHEFARVSSTTARVARASIANLAGVPSIVFGLFGLGFFVQVVGHGVDAARGTGLRYGQPGLLWASLTMAVLTLPIVIVTTEEALRRVPVDLRMASLALGATRTQTLWRVVLPAALPGIMTGAILAVSRAAGEVAPLLLTGVAYSLPAEQPLSLSGQFMHLGYHAFVLATQTPDVDAARPTMYATVLVLLALTFSLNVVAVLVRARARAR